MTPHTLSRRSFLAASSAVPLSRSARAQAANANVLLIMTDQQSMSALGANGNPYLKTPAMDSIVADGISFTESYCTYPVCSPARSSVMTGLMPHQTGVMKNGQAIREGIPNLGEHFRANGYKTYYAGKWHLPSGFGEPPGFETLIGGHTLGAHMDEPLATKCVEFMYQGPDEPFLLVASFMNPHDICHWIRGHKGSRDYDSVGQFPPAPGNMWLDPNEPEYIQHHRYGNFNRMSNSLHISKEWKADDFRHYIHDYYRMCEDVDRQIGRVLSALRFRGLSENTVVVLTSDHGRQGRMLRTDRYKYVVFNGGKRPEQFFDLELDPGEMRNLVGQSEAATEHNRHRELLGGWITQTSDNFRIPIA